MKDEKTINRLNIARGDARRAMEFLEATAGHAPTSIEYEALVTSAIIHYARPFSENERSGLAKALPRVPESVMRDYTSEEIELHGRIINRRNKAIAHSEWNEFPTAVHSDSVIMSRRYSIYPEFMDITPFKVLARKLHARLQDLVADHVLGDP